jgi:hypothetical protein
VRELLRLAPATALIPVIVCSADAAFYIGSVVDSSVGAADLCLLGPRGQKKERQSPRPPFSQSPNRCQVRPSSPDHTRMGAQGGPSEERPAREEAPMSDAIFVDLRRQIRASLAWRE